MKVVNSDLNLALNVTTLMPVRDKIWLVVGDAVYINMLGDVFDPVDFVVHFNFLDRLALE